MHARRCRFAILLLATSGARADKSAEVRAFLDRYDRAYLTGDAEAVAHLLAHDDRVVAEGRPRDRDDARAELTPPDREAPTALHSTVDRVPATVDLAVATGRIAWAKHKKTAPEHFTRVLRREAGHWKAVDEPVSDVAKPAAP